MSQHGFNAFSAGTRRGADLQAIFEALHSGHLGAARPAGLSKGGFWSKLVDANAAELQFFDGVQDVRVGVFDTENHTFKVDGGSEVSTTPTLTALATYGTMANTHAVTISNTTDYVSPTYSYYVTDTNDVLTAAVVVQTSPNIVVPASSLSGDWPHTVHVHAEDVGKAVSSVETVEIADVVSGITLRYWRFYVNYGNAGVGEMRLFSDFAQSGTDLVPSISASGGHANYPATNARDGDNTTMWWKLGVGGEQWLQFDLGASPPEVKSARIIAYNNRTGTGVFSDAYIVASDTGAFAGEELTVVTGLSVAVTPTLNLG